MTKNRNIYKNSVNLFSKISFYHLKNEFSNSFSFSGFKCSGSKFKFKLFPWNGTVSKFHFSNTFSSLSRPLIIKHKKKRQINFLHSNVRSYPTSLLLINFSCRNGFIVLFQLTAEGSLSSESGDWRWERQSLHIWKAAAFLLTWPKK